MCKITVIIEHPSAGSMGPQKITMEAQDGVLSDTLEVFEMVLRCMTYSIDGKKLELVGVDE